jgi:hypothetical protein
MPRCSKKLYLKPIFVKGKEEGKRRKGKAAITGNRDCGERRKISYRRD